MLARLYSAAVTLVTTFMAVGTSRPCALLHADDPDNASFIMLNADDPDNASDIRSGHPAGPLGLGFAVDVAPGPYFGRRLHPSSSSEVAERNATVFFGTRPPTRSGGLSSQPVPFASLSPQSRQLFARRAQAAASNAGESARAFCRRYTRAGDACRSSRPVDTAKDCELHAPS